MNYMMKTRGMFEFGSWKDATLKAGKMPTMTKWVDRVKKDDDGGTFVRCRLAARQRRPVRGDATAEAKKTLFALAAGVREKRRAQGHDGLKIMFIAVKKGASQREV